MKKPIFRCSQLPMLMECHGSQTLVPLFMQHDSLESFEGNMGHWMIASRAIKELGARAPATGLEPPNVPRGYTMPRMSRWLVEWGIRSLDGWIPPHYSLSVEDSFSYEFDRFILNGHMDLYALNRDGSDFLGNDWKLGRKPVPEATRNWQIKGYAALAKRAWSKISHLSFRIAQPWNQESEGFPRISFLEADKSGLDQILSEINDGVNAAIDDAMTVNSGLHQCAWCPVPLHHCPAQLAEIDFMKATITPEGLAAIGGAQDDALLADAVISARTVKKHVEDAETLLKDRIAAAGAVTSTAGTKITTKTQGAKYKVVNPEGAFQAVRELLPPERVPYVLSYSTGALVDEIALANKVNKGGAADITAKTLFDIVMKPNLEQTTSTHLIFQ